MASCHCRGGPDCCMCKPRFAVVEVQLPKSGPGWGVYDAKEKQVVKQRPLAAGHAGVVRRDEPVGDQSRRDEVTADHKPHTTPQDVVRVLKAWLEYEATVPFDGTEPTAEQRRWWSYDPRNDVQSLIEQLETLREAVQALHDWEDGWPHDPATLKELILEAHAVAYPATDPLGYIELDEINGCPHGFDRGLGCAVCDPASGSDE